MSRSEECAALEALLPDWLLGELEPPAAAQVQAHVAGCVSCSAEVQRWQSLENELATIIPVEAQQLPTGLTARAATAVVREQARSQRSRRQTRLLVAGALCLAGGLVACAAVLVVWALAAGGPADLPGSLVDRLAGATGTWLPFVLSGLGGVAICALLLLDDLERLLLPRAAANSTEVEIHA